MEKSIEIDNDILNQPFITRIKAMQKAIEQFQILIRQFQKSIKDFSKLINDPQAKLPEQNLASSILRQTNSISLLCQREIQIIQMRKKYFKEKSEIIAVIIEILSGVENNFTIQEKQKSDARIVISSFNSLQEKFQSSVNQFEEQDFTKLEQIISDVALDYIQQEENQYFKFQEEKENPQSDNDVALNQEELFNQQFEVLQIGDNQIYNKRESILIHQPVKENVQSITQIISNEYQYCKKMENLILNCSYIEQQVDSEIQINNPGSDDQQEEEKVQIKDDYAQMNSTDKIKNIKNIYMEVLKSQKCLQELDQHILDISQDQNPVNFQNNQQESLEEKKILFFQEFSQLKKLKRERMVQDILSNESNQDQKEQFLERVKEETLQLKAKEKRINRKMGFFKQRIDVAMGGIGAAIGGVFGAHFGAAVGASSGFAVGTAINYKQKQKLKKQYEGIHITVIGNNQ